MSTWRCLAIGSSAGWASIVTAGMASGTANPATFGCIALPASFWTAAQLIEMRRKRRRRKTASAKEDG